MTRKKANRQVWQHSLRLSSEDDMQTRLHARLKVLSETGQANRWLVEAALRKLAEETAVQADMSEKVFATTAQRLTDVMVDEPQYTPVEDTP